MQKITANLWFDYQAEEAAAFYVSLFKNSRIISVSHYGEAGPGPEGSVMTVKFQLDGQEYLGLNGGPVFKFTPAISLIVNCENQEEVDYYWEKLSTDGKKGVCGWLTDKYGVSWQIVPSILEVLVNDPDTVKAQKVMKAMLQMKKLVIAELEQAYRQEEFVKLYESISYTMVDRRKAEIKFARDGNRTKIVESFEAENTNTAEMQRQGWQSILDNLKKYAEQADD